MKILQYLIYITLNTSILFVFLINPLTAQDKGNFELAERFTSDNMSQLIGSTSLSVNWIEDSNRLWYEWEDHSGKRWMFADADQGAMGPLFDHDQMASQLSEIFKRGFNRKDLELQNFDYDTDRELFTFHVDSIEFKYDVDRRELIKGDTLSKEEDEPWATYSPDSTWIAFAREHDLYLMKSDDPDSTEYRLTEDGERWYSYQADHGDTTTTERLRSRAQWFEDSQKLYVKRQDWREVDELWVIDMLSERPELETYKYNMPGDQNHYRDELIVFDAATHESVLLDVEKWPDQSIGGPYFNHGGGIFTSDESDNLWFLRRNRTWDTIDVCKADTETGEVEVLWSETYHPYIDAFNVQLSIIKEGEEYIWWSEIHHGVEEKTRTVTRESEEDEEEEIEETYFESTIPSNADLAGNLKGRLLLVIGERDNNVHPANTYRLAEELLKEGKRFDLTVFPGARHGFGRYSAYFERLL